VAGKKLEARFYPCDKWDKALTQDAERAKVIELEKKKHETKKSGGGRGKRKAASDKTNCDNDAGGSKGDNAGAGGGDAGSPTPRDNGGNEFGRGAHKKRKVSST
jgi:hypothetical protein